MGREGEEEEERGEEEGERGGAWAGERGGLTVDREAESSLYGFHFVFVPPLSRAGSKLCYNGNFTTVDVEALRLSFNPAGEHSRAAPGRGVDGKQGSRERPRGADSGCPSSPYRALHPGGCRGLQTVLLPGGPGGKADLREQLHSGHKVAAQLQPGPVPAAALGTPLRVSAYLLLLPAPPPDGRAPPPTVPTGVESRGPVGHIPVLGPPPPQCLMLLAPEWLGGWMAWENNTTTVSEWRCLQGVAAVFYIPLPSAAMRVMGGRVVSIWAFCSPARASLRRLKLLASSSSISSIYSLIPSPFFSS